MQASSAAASSSTAHYIVVPASPVNPIAVQISTATLFQKLTGDFLLEDDGTMYVQTGDIPAMWLRDSSAQTKPYVRFIARFPKLGQYIRAVVERNAKNVLTDPYANAFTAGYKVWEEKWEVDSLAYPLTLAYTYWRRTGDRSMFTPRLHWAWEHTVSTYQCEQHHATCSHYRSRFLQSGRGTDFGFTGMIWCAFRPSDDPVRYPYNIPQNMFAVVALRELAEMAQAGYHDDKLSATASRLANEVDAGIQRYGVVYDMNLGWVYAYEVDGLGTNLLMDDANVPNLLSATYFGYASPNSPLYINTRRLSLSTANPYYYTGKYAAGLGSPHTPTGWVWPLGLVARGLTAETPQETAYAIRTVQDTTQGDELFHESLDPNDLSRFTRTSFGWFEAMYAELLFRSACGFDDDPLPAPSADLNFQYDEQLTPVVVGPPQLWINSVTTFNAIGLLLQEGATL